MAVTPADLRRVPDDGTTVFFPYATDVPAAGRPRLRPGGVDRERRRGRSPLRDDGLRAPATGHRPVQRHRDRRDAARPRHRADLDLHGPVPPALGTRVGGDHRAEDDARHAREAVEPAALRGPPHRRTRHRPTSTPNPRLGNPECASFFWSELIRRNRAASTILAQVGAALRGPGGPFDGWDVAQRHPRRPLPDRQRDQLLHPATRTTRSGATTARRSTTATSRRGSPTRRSTTSTCRSCRS